MKTSFNPYDLFVLIRTAKEQMSSMLSKRLEDITFQDYNDNEVLFKKFTEQRNLFVERFKLFAVDKMTENEEKQFKIELRKLIRSYNYLLEKNLSHLNQLFSYPSRECLVHRNEKQVDTEIHELWKKVEEHKDIIHMYQNANASSNFIFDECDEVEKIKKQISKCEWDRTEKQNILLSESHPNVFSSIKESLHMVENICRQKICKRINKAATKPKKKNSGKKPVGSYNEFFLQLSFAEFLKEFLYGYCRDNECELTPGDVLCLFDFLSNGKRFNERDYHFSYQYFGETLRSLNTRTVTIYKGSGKSINKRCYPTVKFETKLPEFDKLWSDYFANNK